LGNHGLEMEKMQPEEPNENDDAEQSHRRFKEAVEQTLLLRGSRNVESREADGRFLNDWWRLAMQAGGNGIASAAAIAQAATGKLQAAVGAGRPRQPDSRRPEHVYGSQSVDRREGRSATVRGIRRGMDRRENLSLFGKTGTGKTHLLSAIAQELARRGRKVSSWPCALLVQELLVAKRDLKLSRVLKRPPKYEALLIDDLGHVQQSRAEMEVVFTLPTERYDRGTVMLTSNRRPRSGRRSSRTP
jgi:ATPase subunit of ABC transporter with duplicated ATPase domains